MRGLDRLLRLREWRLKEQRQKVTDLERLSVSLRAQIARLEHEVASEKGIALPDRGTDLSGNPGLDGASRLEKLRQSLTELEDEMLRAAQELATTERDVASLGFIRARKEARTRERRKHGRKNRSESAGADGCRQARET